MTVNKLETVQVPCTYQVQVCKPQIQTRTVKVCHYESQVRTCAHQVCEFHCETRTRTCTVMDCKFEAADPRGVRTSFASRGPRPATSRSRPARCGRSSGPCPCTVMGAAHGREEGAGPGLQDGREDAFRFPVASPAVSLLPDDLLPAVALAAAAD